MSSDPVSPLFDAMVAAELPALARVVFLYVYAMAHGQVNPLHNNAPWGAVLSESEIARSTGCSKSTVKRMLTVLEQKEFIERRYRRQRQKPVFFLGPAVPEVSL